MPHTEPRDYFVTMRRDKRTAFLAGPFATHTEALERVDAARQAASKVDPWSDFDSFGTSSLPTGSGVVGKLNTMLGVIDPPPY